MKQLKLNEEDAIWLKNLVNLGYQVVQESYKNSVKENPSKENMSKWNDVLNGLNKVKSKVANI